MLTVWELQVYQFPSTGLRALWQAARFSYSSAYSPLPEYPAHSRGEWVKAEVGIVPHSWFHLCSLEKRFLLGLWGMTFFPKLVHFRSPSQGWAQTDLQGLGNPELQRQTLLGLAKPGSRKTIHTKSNSLWPQRPTQLSPKGVVSAVTHVCLRGSEAALCGGWEQGGGERVVCRRVTLTGMNALVLVSTVLIPQEIYLNGDTWLPSISFPQSHSRGRAESNHCLLSFQMLFFIPSPSRRGFLIFWAWTFLYIFNAGGLD